MVRETQLPLTLLVLPGSPNDAEDNLANFDDGRVFRRTGGR